MIRRLCVDECVGATGNLSPPMSNKAKKTSNRLTVLFVNSNKLAPGLYGDGTTSSFRYGRPAAEVGYSDFASAAAIVYETWDLAPLDRTACLFRPPVTGRWR